MKMIRKILSFVLTIGLLFSALTIRVNAQSQPIDTSKNAANLDAQIQKDEAAPNPDLQTLLRQYYYYQHAYNDRAGVSAPVWMLQALFWEPAKKLVGISANLVNTIQMEIMLEKWWVLKDSAIEVKDLVLKGDWEGAAVITALNLPDEKFPIPVASLFLGIGKNEFLKWRSNTLYTQILEKIEKDDPTYCVYKETVGGTEHCYRSWLEYRNAFQPKESIFFEGKLPRSNEETKNAEKLWQEMIKNGEFSDGQKYTVSEMTGENWGNTYKDVSWKKPTGQDTEKEKPTPTLVFQGENIKTTDMTVSFKDTVILDVAKEESGCFSIGIILWAPGNEHFLVTVSCFEGDNQLYLFKADGSGKKKITGKWDVVNYSEVEWDKDGKSFVYHRINSCCVAPSEIGESGPPVGMVRYDVATGAKTLLGDSCGNNQCEANVGESAKTCPRDCQAKASPQTESQSSQPSPPPSIHTPTPNIPTQKQVTLDPNPPFLLYPGAVTAGGRSNIPNTVMSPNPDEPGSVFVQAYVVKNVSGQEIVRWYKEQFAEAGWQVKKNPHMAGDSDFIFQKGDSKTEWVWLSVLDREYWDTIAMNEKRDLAPDETAFRLFWR